MATENTAGQVEYEFSSEQDQLIGSLGRKMALVGFAVMLFGGLQMVNGVFSLFATRSPDRVLAAAKEAGLPESNLQQLEKALTSERWLSPMAATSLAFAITGLFMLLIGIWTQQAGVSFAGIVGTKGHDIRRLMDALGALHKKYSLMFALLWIAVITSLISFAFALYHSFAARS
jgi:hypothetical protein